MRIVILTTDTAHHRYFLKRLSAELPAGTELVLNIFETRVYPWVAMKKKYARKSFPNIWKGYVMNPYVPSAELDAAQSRYEEKKFFPDGDQSLPHDLLSASFHNVNDEECLSAIQETAPDILLVYGTGKIKPHIFNAAPMGAVNAHGGLLPDYRGLDTNLWAAFEGRPQDMAVSLHKIDEELDTGPIYDIRHLKLTLDLSLASLRYHTAVLCTDMFIDVIKGIQAGTLPAKKQDGVGRYFGPMPAISKRKTDKILRAYAASNAREKRLD
jgi:folate-dependent phosphoribosylglycinamide formyltransferase PurN